MVENLYRAAAIGRYGAGDFGHGLHQAYAGLDNVEFVAVADAVAEGREKGLRETGALRAYEDFGEMLRREKPDLVSVCPRYTDCHVEMVLACLEEGAHVYCEKPMTWNLEEGDRIVERAAVLDRKVAVAHQSVHLPLLKGVKEMVAAGRIGPLAAIHAHGKQDARGGGEDMIVLGTHLFNAMRFLAGDVIWMSARVTVDGRELAVSDVAEASEPVGPVAGDSVQSYYAFDNGVAGHFDSRRYADGNGQHYGMEIVGLEGTIAVRSGVISNPMIYPHRAFDPSAQDREWLPLTELEILPLHAGNGLAIVDLIESIEQDRPPLSSASDAVAALEMILGAYESQITGGRVFMPMQRRHPLLAWEGGFYGKRDCSAQCPDTT